MPGQGGCLALGVLRAFLCKFETYASVHSVAYVRCADYRGNLDLTPVFPFLGKTQIQILSFLTSLLVAITHGFTAWAVTERVLLRDE